MLVGKIPKKLAVGLGDSREYLTKQFKGTRMGTVGCSLLIPVGFRRLPY